MNKIVTTKDVATRDSQPSVKEWIRVTSVQLRLKGMLDVVWNGKIGGKAVPAFISNGRAQALCPEPGCGGCEYVDPDEPVFFCMTCGGRGSGVAHPVQFPAGWDEICAALLERDMVQAAGGHLVNRAFNARPAVPELRRDWAPKGLENEPRLFGRVLPDSFGAKPAEMRARKAQVMERRKVNDVRNT